MLKGAKLSILPDQAVHEDDPALTIWSKTHFNLDHEYPSRYVVTVSHAGSGDLVSLRHKNRDYEIALFYDPARKAEFEQLLDQMLSTFKFLN